MQARKIPVIKAKAPLKRLSFRITHDLLKSFNKKAEQKGYTASGYLRALVLAQLTGKK